MQIIESETFRRPGALFQNTSSGSLTCQEVALPELTHTLVREVEALPESQCLYSSGDYRVLLTRAHQTPSVMREIGRLRELSFRNVGEGTGKALDLDEYDRWYEQLFVWSCSQKRILGAYRLGRTELITAEQGLKGLYLKSLFHFDERFVHALGPSIELGRSFVRVECQGMGRVLALLWRGIGRYIARHPECRRALGPVSVSATYSDRSRQLIATQLQRGPYSHSLSCLVQPMQPLPGVECDPLGPIETVRELSRRIADQEPSGQRLPVLISEYLKLGGKFCAFSVDPDFGSCLDGLVVIDLDETPARLLSIYMGGDNYQEFRAAGAQRWAC